MNLPVEVIDAVREGRCVLFMGSWATREAALAAGRAYPDGKGLATALGWKRPRVLPGMRPKPGTPSVTEGAAALEAARGRAALDSTLRALVGADDVPPTSAHLIAARRFPLIFTTCWDDVLDRAAPGHAARGTDEEVELPDPTAPVLVRMRGGFSAPGGPIATVSDRENHPLSKAFADSLRFLLRRAVVLFVGFRPDEEEFEQLFAELSACYGGELPRCHLAVAQGNISDYLWQKWVWRGLLLFTADPTECLEELDRRVAQ